MALSAADQGPLGDGFHRPEEGRGALDFGAMSH